MLERLTPAGRRLPFAFLVIVATILAAACSNGSGGAGY
jgi:hypothetical protein